MLKVIKTKEQNEYWVYNPIGGRGRYCYEMKDGTIKDKEKSMFLEVSPQIYINAIKKYKELK